MIAKLTGTLDEIGEHGCVIDVGGVGYQVFCSGRTLGRLPGSGESASLLIETHVRDDHIHLYGFADVSERAWFRLLTTVQGVGARMALALLSTLGPDEIALAIASEDKAALTRASGVGGKVAQRIIGELRDKAGDLAPADGTGIAITGAQVIGIPEAGAAADAVSALVNLGYRRSEAAGAVGHAARRLGTEATAEALIRAGLQELGT